MPLDRWRSSAFGGGRLWPRRGCGRGRGLLRFGEEVGHVKCWYLRNPDCCHSPYLGDTSPQIGPQENGCGPLGHRALFPDAIADWARLLESAERLASLGALSPLVASRRGGPRSAKVELPGLDLDALGARARTEVPVLATSLIEETRAATLDVLGDTEGTASLVATEYARFSASDLVFGSVFRGTTEGPHA